MQVRMVKMFKQGVEIDRPLLNDRYATQLRGKLTVTDKTDQGMHRPTKVARLVSEFGSICELLDVHLV